MRILPRCLRLEHPGYSLALCLVLSAAACTYTDTKQPFDADAHVNVWVKLWNTYDLSLVDELFVADSSVTYFSSEREGLIEGIDAVRAHHVGFGFVEGGRTPENELWVEQIHATVVWPATIVTGIWYFGNRAQDTAQVQHGPMTFVYVQVEGRYRLAHLHFSEYLATPDSTLE